MDMDQLQKIMESLEDGRVRKLELDGKITFQCKRCGKCCVNNTIVVSAYDVIRMRHSLKMTTSKMIGAGFLAFNIGPNSGMPIATIRFKCVDKALSICPFLAPVYQVTSEEMNRILAEKDFNAKDSQLAMNQYGDAILMCGIYPDRPFRCRAYPLGRMSEYQEGVMDITKAKQVWFHIDLPEYCNGPKDAQEQTVREWLHKRGMDEYLGTSERCTAMLEKMVKSNVLKGDDISIVSLAFAVLYDFDSILGDGNIGMSDEGMLDFVEESIDMFIKVASEKTKAFVL